MELAIVSCVAGVASAVVDVGSCSVALIRRQFMYLYNYRTNFEKLIQEVKKLERARNEVKQKVDAAESNLEEITKKVSEWLDEVNKIIDDAKELIRKKANNYNSHFDDPVARDEEVEHENVNPDEAEKLTEENANNPCFMRCSPSLMTRYKHSKEALRIVKDIALHLQEEESFGDVAQPTRLPDAWLVSDKGYETFDSRKSTLDNVLKSLKDANVNMIGVYGMGGIGKTTLVKEVWRQVIKNKELFDEVVFVEVTESPDKKKIQDEIANQLGLKLPNEPEFERINRLHARLKNEKKILLILDNIWHDKDLEEIGIPSGADLGKSKLLLTARDRDVLDRMDCTPFPIDKLSEEEAKTLFKKMAGNVIEECNLKSVADDVVKECGGLPIAIVTVAKALRNKRSQADWEDALRELRMPSPTELTGVLLEAYSKIALSYKYLKGEELKEIFLISSLMENDTSISDLFKHVMCLDILSGVNLTMEQARIRLDKVVHQLKRLLLVTRQP